MLVTLLLLDVVLLGLVGSEFAFDVVDLMDDNDGVTTDAGVTGFGVLDNAALSKAFLILFLLNILMSFFITDSALPSVVVLGGTVVLLTLNLP